MCPADDGPVLVCGTASGAVRCLDARTGTELPLPTPHTGAVTGLAFCPPVGDAPALLVSAGEDGTVRVRDALAGAQLRRFTADRDGVTALAAGEVAGHQVVATGGPA
ncbi:WD40 repeat domain-containing protein [Kitasatospora arboriphila]